mgnify:CR=1 FL=1
MNSYLHVHNFSSAKSLFVAIALGGAIVIAAPVSAHHGTAPNYKMDETILLKGIVTERGGALSHAAIVAREYGIPAVVGCPEASKRIVTGQRLRVDGAKGEVWILG